MMTSTNTFIEFKLPAKFIQVPPVLSALATGHATSVRGLTYQT